MSALGARVEFDCAKSGVSLASRGASPNHPTSPPRANPPAKAPASTTASSTPASATRPFIAALSSGACRDAHATGQGPFPRLRAVFGVHEPHHARAIRHGARHQGRHQRRPCRGRRP
jgi:hypothetical protein